MEQRAEPAGQSGSTANSAAIAALTRAVYFLDRSLAPSPKIRAFQRAASIVGELTEDELVDRVRRGTLTDIDGIGQSTAAVIGPAVDGSPPDYLDRLDRASRVELTAGADLRGAIRGDCHMHTTWSDGGAAIDDMARTAAAIGHEWIVVTDHSPRLTVAHGLQPERLAAQLDEIDRINARADGPTILTGMEVDILEDGSLDMTEELLARLDVVVASVHSKLSMPADAMTRRMVLAVSSPHVDILGHCTGRKLVGRGRPPSAFDADMVFAACARAGTAVEINCRPERQDPPKELLELALEWGCDVAINTDAHAPGHMEWQNLGVAKAAACGIPPERILNTLDAASLRQRASANG